MPYPFLSSHSSTSSSPSVRAASTPVTAPITRNFLSAANTVRTELTLVPIAAVARQRPGKLRPVKVELARLIEEQAATVQSEQLARINATRVWMMREREKNYAQYLHMNTKNPTPRSVLARQALHYYFLSIPVEPRTREELASAIRYINAFESRCRSLHVSGYDHDRIRKLQDGVRTYYVKQLLQPGPEASAAVAVYGEAFFEYEQVVRKEPNFHRRLARLYCAALFFELEATRPFTQLELDEAESKLRKLSMVFEVLGDEDLAQRQRLLSQTIYRHYADVCSLAYHRSEVARLRAVYLELAEQAHDTPTAVETFFRSRLLYAHALIKQSIAEASNLVERTAFEQELALLKRELQRLRPDLLQLHPELRDAVQSAAHAPSVRQ